jgi:hypothetical protein
LSTGNPAFCLARRGVRPSSSRSGRAKADNNFVPYSFPYSLASPLAQQVGDSRILRKGLSGSPSRGVGLGYRSRPSLAVRCALNRLSASCLRRFRGAPCKGDDDPAGERPARQVSFQPEAIGAAKEVTNSLKHFGVEGHAGVLASMQARTRVNAEQTSKHAMRKPTLPLWGEGRRRWGRERHGHPTIPPG